MRLIITLSFAISNLLCSARTEMYVITDSIRLPVTVYPPYELDVLCYIEPGERVLSDTVSNNNIAYCAIHKQNGSVGYVLKSHLRKAADTSLFRITYPPEQFCFSSDTSKYAHVRGSFGWGAIHWWAGYSADMDPSDTFNVPRWTKLAYDGDTTALWMLLHSGYGDCDAAGQFEFNKWKLINRWSDSALASLILAKWICPDPSDPEDYLLYHIQTPFGEDVEKLREYYRICYPMCSVLLERSLEYSMPLDKKEKRRFSRMISTGKLPKSNRD